MADAKISALVGATTPLAGAEELPLVQSATTKKVTVADLTAGRNISCAGLTTTGNTILGDSTTDNVRVNGYMGVGGAGASTRGLTVVSSALTGTTQIGINSAPTGTSAATSAIRGFSALPATAAASFTVAQVIGFFANDATKGAGSTITSQYGVFIDDQIQGTNNYGLRSEVSSGANKWNIYASGTADNYMAGNLAFASGKGIDFSADGQAAGMTSELLDDYEEGTWTPAWTNATVGDGTSTGRYTKIGRMVHVEVVFTLGSTSTIGSNAEINNLPFGVSASFGSFGGGSFTDDGTNTHQASCFAVNNTSRLIPFRYNISAPAAFQTGISATAPFTWAVNDRIRLSAVYAID